MGNTGNVNRNDADVSTKKQPENASGCKSIMQDYEKLLHHKLVIAISLMPFPKA